MNFVLNYVHEWKSLHLFCFICMFSNFVSPYFSLKTPLETKRLFSLIAASCPVLLIVIYPLERNCLRENLSFLVLACWVELLISSCFNLRWCTDNGRLVSLCDGSHCQGKIDLSDSLTSRKQCDATESLTRNWVLMPVIFAQSSVLSNEHTYIIFISRLIGSQIPVHSFRYFPECRSLKVSHIFTRWSLIGYAPWWMVDEWLYYCMMLHWSYKQGNCRWHRILNFQHKFWVSFFSIFNVKLDIWWIFNITN